MRNKKLIGTVLIMAILSVVALGLTILAFFLIDEIRFAGGLVAHIAGTILLWFLFLVALAIGIPVCIYAVKNPRFAKLVGVYALIVVMIVVGVWVYRSYVRFDNVFDQLYHTEGSRFGQMADTRLHGRLDYVETGGRRVIYNGIGLGENRSLVIETNQVVPPFPETRPALSFSFAQEFPESNESIFLSYLYYLDTSELFAHPFFISSPLYFEEYILRDWGSDEAYEDFLRRNNLQHNPEMAFGFSDREDSDVTDDFLARHNLTREEIEELHHWFLFEYFLPLWHETTQIRTRFSPDNWGEFTLVDEAVG